VADVSVRPARLDDVPDIARVQVSTWQQAYERLLPPAVLAAATQERAAAEWAAAVTAPPAGHQVLVAVDAGQVVGFAAFGPGEIVTLLVEPRWARRGHGSRLLAAAVDALGDGVVVAWLLAGDLASESFYASAGWERDGAVRNLIGDGGSVREDRWHVSLAEGAGG
jgi:GNAT superfamily N-acetyltransferase